MALNPLAPVTEYQSMLNRIFWFTSASALGAIWLLRLHIPALDASLCQLDFAVALGGDKLRPAPGGYLLPALAAGMATRVFRLHARVSDWLGIREHFDLHVILREMADELGVDADAIGLDRLRKARHRFMRKAFYPYVSSSQPQVDAQLVQQALDAWSWFWIGIEATLLFALTGYALIASGAYGPGFRTLGGVVAFAVLGLPAIRSQCKRYAVAQVRAIPADPTRAAAVRAAFDELSAEPAATRRAA